MLFAQLAELVLGRNVVLAHGSVVELVAMRSSLGQLLLVVEFV
jgi:hypothetical protein